MHKESQKSTQLDKETPFDAPKTFKTRCHGQRSNNCSGEGLKNNNRKFKQKNKSNKTCVEQTEGIDKSELDRTKVAGECQRCAWHWDRKGAHKRMDCFQWA